MRIDQATTELHDQEEYLTLTGLLDQYEDIWPDPGTRPLHIADIMYNIQVVIENKYMLGEPVLSPFGEALLVGHDVGGSITAALYTVLTRRIKQLVRLDFFPTLFEMIPGVLDPTINQPAYVERLLATTACGSGLDANIRTSINVITAEENDYEDIIDDAVTVLTGIGAYPENPYTKIREFLEMSAAWNSSDLIMDQLQEVFGFDQVQFMTIDIPALVEDTATTFVRSSCDTTLKEPLLTVGGTSVFRPSHIFPRVDTLPAILQDITLTIDSTKIYRTDKNAPEETVMVLKPRIDEKTQIDTYSKNIFKQEDKPFQTVDMRVPDIKTFQGQFTRSNDGVYEVAFETNLGPPDFIFIRLEREETESSPFSSYPLAITELVVKTLSQDIQSVSCLSEYQLLSATKRNSNMRADLNELRKQTGAILLSKTDLCDFIDFNMYEVGDTMKGSFGTTEDKIRAFPLGIEDTRSEIEADQEFLVKMNLLVQFIYNDHKLQGEAGTMRFKHGVERMAKLSGL
jgi:hypothetical protein